MAFAARMKELMKKYGKVAAVVHVSVSAASITGLYVAINNNVDVDAIFRRIGISPTPTTDEIPTPTPAAGEATLDGYHDAPVPVPGELRNRTRELAASSGGALALALMCNKALLPVRIPITVALTPPIARFLARWKVVKT
uniref:DUF1279 domain-containing protein n=1 Tax=Leersia perrieri TaxID=77586 RepID=A0A0D9XG68_9ORYZ